VSHFDLALPAAALTAGGNDVEPGANDLVERLRAGERAAIGLAYEAHHGAVRAFARRLVGDESVAEDIVHDTFVALPRAVQKFRGEGSLRGFLIGVAANHGKRHIRSAVRRRRAFATLAERPVAAPADPETETARRRLADRLSAELDKLPIDQRVAFVLCDVEQRTSTEVGVILGIPEATVRTRLFHARKKLRDGLAAEDPRG
jgi:RNA polymerase sigma-70 factor (ECF subfamily)